jgi:hypothetical protein
MLSHSKPTSSCSVAVSTKLKRRHGERGPDRQPRKMRNDALFLFERIENYSTEVNPAHTSKWLSSMRERLAFIPRCEFDLRTGDKCQCPAIKNYHLCINHADRRELQLLDNRRYEAAQAIIDRCSSPSIVLRARRLQLAIERRRLLFLWSPRGANAPETVGATLFLSAGDSNAVATRLKQAGVDIFADRLTYRAVDKLRWEAFHVIIGRISEEKFTQRVKRHLREDNKYWSMKTS